MALSTFDNLIICSTRKKSPEVHLLQKCVGIQPDPVKTDLGDTLPINSYILVGFVMIVIDDEGT